MLLPALPEEAHSAGLRQLFSYCMIYHCTVEQVMLILACLGSPLACFEPVVYPVLSQFLAHTDAHAHACMCVHVLKMQN